MLFSVGDLSLYTHFVVSTEVYRGDAVMVGFFDRSKIKVQAAVQLLGKRRIYAGRFNYGTVFGDCSEWTGAMHTVSMGRERFTYCCAVTKAVGKKWMLTTLDSEKEDWYNFLMNKYKLPLLKEWVLPIRDRLLRDEVICRKRLCVRTADEVPFAFVPFNGKKVDTRDLLCYDIEALNNDSLTEVVSALLREKVICITQKRMKPLEFTTFDEYMTTYGPSLVDNLNKAIEPLVDLKPNVDTVAFKEKKLFPQQAACVNGINALKKHGVNYGVLIESMGVGKTIQAMAAIEGAKIEEYLLTHPGATLKDAYQPGVIKYRAIIMAPGHLVEKWAKEIEKEIPYATATIVKGLSTMVELKSLGKEPKGKEFYVISKDGAKLDTLLSPIPTKMKTKRPALRICSDCKNDEERPRIVYQKGHGLDAECPDCKGKSFEPYPFGGSFVRALVCPECGEILLRFKNYTPGSSSFGEAWMKASLRPEDFSGKKNENSFCYHCGASLWSVKPKNLVLPNSKPKESKWYRIKHFSNHAHNGTTSAYVLRGYEDDYKRTCTTSEGWELIANESGPRRTSVARYIKKQLKGYFDFCVLDECHKYLGDSAQSVAAHQIVKASKFTIGLTGTISNGTARAFYGLFYLCEPKKLLDMGYKHSKSECDRFCKEYGCVEQVFECKRSDDFTQNVMSRGKALGQPKVKPGISPVIFGRLLMDRCIFLDISDLSKYLPKFTETVEIVDTPPELEAEYRHVIDVLKVESKNGAGMALLSVMLQFGLSYLDKPYGRLPVMDPFREDSLIIRPKNFDEYASLDCLTPKEERLVEIVNSELAEGRNCFVYANYTASPETNIVYRLKDIIETKCNLKGRVEIIQSSSPAAAKREEWFHKRASEGIKVFITNPANVETGLDFCFEHNGRRYNYPTLIFYQVGYNLSIVWQASRRAFRLNQTEECRNYYLAYDNTLQSAALEIMAKKQVATAAIQGHFSTEGLSAMAKGVDARAQLAAALSRGDMSDRKTLENMFDALSGQKAEEDDRYGAYVPSPSFYEVVGYAKEDAFVVTGFGGFAQEVEETKEEEITGFTSGFGSFGSFDSFSSFGGFGGFETSTSFADYGLSGSFGSFGNFTQPMENLEPTTTLKKKTKQDKRALEGQSSLFDMMPA